MELVTVPRAAVTAVLLVAAALFVALLAVVGHQGATMRSTSSPVLTRIDDVASLLCCRRGDV
jgi:hypothetical protein